MDERLRNLHDRLKSERLFVQNEKETIRELHATVVRRYADLRRSARVATAQAHILEMTERTGAVLTPADCARKLRDLDYTKFVDATSTTKLGVDDARAVGELVAYVIDRPRLLAEILHTCERAGQDTKALCHAVCKCFYNRCTTPDDELQLAVVLDHLVAAEVATCDVRLVFRGGAMAFTLLFSQWAENLFDVRTFVVAALEQPVAEVIQAAEETGYLDYDPEKVTLKLSEDERESLRGANGENERALATEKFRARLDVSVSQLASFALVFLASLRRHVQLFPFLVRWVARRLVDAVQRVKVVEERDLHGLLTDAVFSCVICPAINDPHKYGIVADIMLTDVVRNNLRNVSKILSDLALIDLERRDKRLAEVHKTIELDDWKYFLNDLLADSGDFEKYTSYVDATFPKKSAVLMTEKDIKTVVRYLHMAKGRLPPQFESNKKELISLLSAMPNLSPAASTNPPPPVPARSNMPRLTTVSYSAHVRSPSAEDGRGRSLSVLPSRTSRTPETNRRSSARLQTRDTLLAANDILVVPIRFGAENEGVYIDIKAEDEILNPSKKEAAAAAAAAATTKPKQAPSPSNAPNEIVATTTEKTNFEDKPVLPTTEDLRRAASLSELAALLDRRRYPPRNFDVHTEAGDTATSTGGSVYEFEPLCLGRPTSLPVGLDAEGCGGGGGGGGGGHARVSTESSQVSSCEGFQSPDSSRMLQRIDDFPELESCNNVNSAPPTPSSMTERLLGSDSVEDDGAATPSVVIDETPKDDAASFSAGGDNSNDPSAVAMDLLQVFDPICPSSDTEMTPEAEKETMEENKEATANDRTENSQLVDAPSQQQETLASASSQQQQQESRRQKLFKKVSGSKLGRIFRRKDQSAPTSGDSTPAALSPLASPHISPRSSPVSSPKASRKARLQRGQKKSKGVAVGNSESAHGSRRNSTEPENLMEFNSPPNAANAFDDEDITLKYRLLSQRKKEEEESNRTTPVDERNDDEELTANRPVRGELTESIAFCDVKRHLRLIFSHFDLWPSSLYHYGDGGGDLKQLLHCWAVQATVDNDSLRSAQIGEALRCLEKLPVERVSEVFDGIEADYRKRVGYIAYLTTMKRSFVNTLSLLERLQKRVDRDKAACWRKFVVFAMKQLFKRHEQDITSFVMRFDDAQAMDEKSDFMVEFLEDVKSFMSEDEAFDNLSEERKDVCIHVAEHLSFVQIYHGAFFPNGDVDFANDRILHDSIHQMAKTVKVTDAGLQIDETYRKGAPWEAAQNHLLKMKAYKTPRDKLCAIRRCCSTVINLLHVACPSRVAGADDCFPVLVYVLIKANPPHLRSTVQFIANFYESVMSGEDAYWWTQFCMAVEYIKTILLPSGGKKN